VSQEYSYGIYGDNSININGGTIDITTGDTTESRGIGIYSGDLNMTSGSLTATSGKGTRLSHGIYCTNATISGGTVVATAGNVTGYDGSTGIKTTAGITISGTANVTAIGGNATYHSSGVKGSVNITGGSLLCKGGNSDTRPSGAYAFGSYGVTDVLTIGTNASFTASGIDKAVYSSETAIRNSITGTGWTDTAGTEGAAVIPVSTTGQSFDYKKVQFPEVHLSNIAATAIGYTGTYDGQQHGITVNISNPTSGATVKYGTTEGTYDLNTAPTYKNAGTYTVYYKITAAGYNSETGSAKVTINKATASVTTAPTAVSGLTSTGQAQVLITSGTSSGGTMQYTLGTSETSAPDSGWSTTLPGATDAGDYYVWYKVVGDDNYEGTAPVCIKVTISGSSAKQEEEEKAEKTENIDKNQKKSSVSTVTAGKKTITLKWKKQAKGGIKGYEIQYSTDKFFKKNVKTITIKKAKITSTKIKKLKSKKKYYVRIRTYKMSGSEKVYSNWSKAKSVKVK
ncbi:MAG: fibronectin type III domain-containing protein, partial [Butyrivibrio sp.]|nr:fibronectin type III domain-containing protein [Butyrivibrio sp.]